MVKTPEEKREYQRAWRAAHPGYYNKEHKEYSRQYKEAHREEINAKRREWRARDKAQAVPKLACNNLEKQKNYNYRIKQKFFDMYGGRCEMCGEKDRDVLVLDHINNDGALKRKTLKMTGNMEVIYATKNYLPNEYQILCHNCNFRKELHRRREQTT